MKLRSLFLVAVSALVALASLVSVATAETQEAMSLDTMIDRADHIVVGRVVRSRARWRKGSIVTRSLFAVDETLKGGGVRRLRITQLGGTVRHPRLGVPVQLSVSGEQALTAGEHLVLFVGSAGGVTQIVGGSQGKLRVQTDPLSQRSRIAGMKRLRTERTAASRVKIASEAMTLDDLRERIRARAQGNGGGTQ